MPEARTCTWFWSLPALLIQKKYSTKPFLYLPDANDYFCHRSSCFIDFILGCNYAAYPQPKIKRVSFPLRPVQIWLSGPFLYQQGLHERQFDPKLWKKESRKSRTRNWYFVLCKNNIHPFAHDLEFLNQGLWSSQRTDFTITELYVQLVIPEGVQSHASAIEIRSTTAYPAARSKGRAEEYRTWLGRACHGLRVQEGV